MTLFDPIRERLLDVLRDEAPLRARSAVLVGIDPLVRHTVKPEDFIHRAVDGFDVLLEASVGGFAETSGVAKVAFEEPGISAGGGGLAVDPEAVFASRLAEHAGADVPL